MIFTEIPLHGAFVITPDKAADDRGFFARTWCAQAFADRGLDSRLAQCSVSFNRRAGTLRGMHHQVAPHEETKLVRCTRGRLFDVIIDLRPESATYLGHHGITLAADEHDMVYVPAGFAHGFVTLEDETEVFYQISTPHVPAAGRGIRWDDPVFAIAWPVSPRVISERDRGFPDFVPA